jgi:hypothetical protein
MWISCINHDPRKYAELLPKLGAGDLFVLLVAGDDRERVPPEFVSLLPVAPSEIDRRLASGKSIAEAHTANNTRVVLLAAPSVEALRELARTSELLE